MSNCWMNGKLNQSHVLDVGPWKSLTFLHSFSKYLLSISLLHVGFGTGFKPRSDWLLMLFSCCFLTSAFLVMFGAWGSGPAPPSPPGSWMSYMPVCCGLLPPNLCAHRAFYHQQPT